PPPRFHFIWSAAVPGLSLIWNDAFAAVKHSDSSNGAASFTQPIPESQQSAAGPLTHAPPPHVSLSVQASPSSHGAELFGCVQPPAPSQMSSVHGLPS